MRGGYGGHSLFVALDPAQEHKVFAIGFTSKMSVARNAFPHPTFYSTENVDDDGNSVKEDVKIKMNGDWRGSQINRQEMPIDVYLKVAKNPLLVEIILEAKNMIFEVSHPAQTKSISNSRGSDKTRKELDKAGDEGVSMARVLEKAAEEARKLREEAEERRVTQPPTVFDAMWKPKMQGVKILKFSRLLVDLNIKKNTFISAIGGVVEKKRRDARSAALLEAAERRAGGLFVVPKLVAAGEAEAEAGVGAAGGAEAEAGGGAAGGEEAEEDVGAAEAAHPPEWYAAATAAEELGSPAWYLAYNAEQKAKSDAQFAAGTHWFQVEDRRRAAMTAGERKYEDEMRQRERDQGQNEGAMFHALDAEK